jgi:hypothetical protein
MTKKRQAVSVTNAKRKRGPSKSIRAIVSPKLTDKEQRFVQEHSGRTNTTLSTRASLAARKRSERERECMKVAAAQSPASLVPFEEWLKRLPRTPEDIALARHLRAELQAMAIHGWEATYEFIEVNRKLEFINGLPARDFLAREAAYQADVERFSKALDDL